MFKFLLSLYILYLIFPLCLAGQNRGLDGLDLNQINATTSIEFRRDDKDLVELKKAIGERQVVMLGEFTHQEATTFKAKARIVRYLIENMGFNVLALESSMGEVYRINQQARDKEDFLSFMTINDFSVDKNEFGFWKYIYAFSRPTTRKIDLYGFDINLGFYRHDNNLGLTNHGFLCFLEQEITYASPNILNTENWVSYKKLYHRLSDLNKNELEDFKIYSDNLIAEAQKSTSSDKLRISYLSQLLKNLYGFAHFDFNSPPFPNKNTTNRFFEEARFHGLRDKQLAENLSWIIDRSLNAGKKVIVWSSTYHVSRNLKRMQGFDTTGIRPMGEYLWKKYPGKIYSIGFIGYDRKPGIIYHNEGIARNQKSENYEAKVENERGELIGTVLLKTSVAIDTAFVEQPPLAQKGSLEYLLHEKNAKFAFMDLSKELKDKKFYLSPTFDKPYYATWSNVLDGVYFIDKIEPFHRKALQSYNREINYSEKIDWFWPSKEGCKD